MYSVFLVVPNAHAYTRLPPSQLWHLLRPSSLTTSCLRWSPSLIHITVLLIYIFTSRIHRYTVSLASSNPSATMMKTAAPLPISKQADEADASAVWTAETLLRVAPIGFCIAALILTIKNSVENDFGSISYSDLGSFKYLVYMNGLCAGYSIFSALYTAIPRPLSLSRAWTLFFLDQVVTYAILAAGAVATEIVYLAYKGDEDVTWSRACGVFSGFCRKAMASVGITFGAVVCYILLSLISSYRLFSTYHAPISTFAAAVDDNEANECP